MSRREELEKELEIVNDRIENADDDVPVDVLRTWRKEYDSIFFELDNLYDNQEND